MESDNVATFIGTPKEHEKKQHCPNGINDNQIEGEWQTFDFSHIQLSSKESLFDDVTLVKNLKAKRPCSWDKHY